MTTNPKLLKFCMPVTLSQQLHNEEVKQTLTIKLKLNTVMNTLPHEYPNTLTNIHFRLLTKAGSRRKSGNQCRQKQQVPHQWWQHEQITRAANHEHCYKDSPTVFEISYNDKKNEHYKTAIQQYKISIHKNLLHTWVKSGGVSKCYYEIWSQTCTIGTERRHTVFRTHVNADWNTQVTRATRLSRVTAIRLTVLIWQWLMPWPSSGRFPLS